MTLKELYKYCSDKLSFGECGDFEALCIFDDLLGLTKERILLSEIQATEEQIKLVNDVIFRRLNGEPLQYILGKWDFYDLTFEVGEGVLIPRPETEMLVDFALEKLEEIGIVPDAIDALSLANEAGSSKAVNIVLMGRLAKYFDIPYEKWITAIENTVAPKFIEMNKKAFALGYNA